MEPPNAMIPEFKIYNRYQELERKAREEKELAWERELLLAMNASDPLSGTTTSQRYKKHSQILHSDDN